MHLIAQQLFDLANDLSGLADCDETFKQPPGRGDELAEDSFRLKADIPLPTRL